MKKIALLCLLLVFATGFAQFSKTHYIPPLSGTDGQGGSIREQFLYISTPSVAPVNFKIIQLGGSTILGTVSRNSPYVYDVGFGTATQLHVSESQVNTIRSDKGYVIEAEDMIYVTVRVLAGYIAGPPESAGNHAGEIVSKGLAALGTQFRIGAFNSNEAVGTNYSANHYVFIAILATENNTIVQFEDIRPGVELLNNESVGNNPAWVTLNAGESYVMAVKGPHDENRDGLLGALVSSDKPIVVNCGSLAGSNATQNLDLGFDQIVSAERTGKEYIFIKSTGADIVERILLVGHEDNTLVYLNGSPGASFLLNAGEYIELDGSDYTANGNLYVNTDKNVFAYQSIGDGSSAPGEYPNQELFFVPPLNCETPHVIDNIPLIERIGTRIFTGRVTMVTETGSTLNFRINGIDYTLGQLAFQPGIIITGPTSVVGNPNFETYTITGLSGNVAVFSTSQLYLASYGTNANATFGGYYSGFTFKPEISFVSLDPTQQGCIPNVTLSVNTLSAFDVFQWFFNGSAIPGATNSAYNPTQPGYYYVQATIADCGTTLISDEIPISSCPTDVDNDSVNDNIDKDNDRDGIANCTESYGDAPFGFPGNGTISIGNYANAYTQANTFGGAVQTDHTFTGDANGNFFSSVSAGKGNTVTNVINFTNPISIEVDYVTLGTPSFELTSDSEFILKTDPNQTITVLNPGNQLLIDTNYDGIYESGITNYSSFEIRFRLNQPMLTFGTGTFSFHSYLTTSLTYIQKNLSDLAIAKAAFFLKAKCVPKNSDNDGIPDQLDLDSDNDGILDNLEAQGNNFVSATTIDLNKDGLADIYGSGIVPTDTDGDGVMDYLDRDSDNDGIFDLFESGSGAPDLNLSGTVDGPSGTNGIPDNVETFPDSGILNYTIADSDADNSNNYLELDSDNDGCTDVIEASFIDENGDGILGDSTTIVNASGVIINAVSGYTLPTNNNYTIAAPLSITTQPPQTVSACDQGNASITIVSNPDPTDGYQWQILIGSFWSAITDNATYSGSTTATLQIANASMAMNGSRYRVLLSRIGNTCNLLSDDAILTVNPLPVINSPLNLTQCDLDGTGNAITDVNLRQQETFISANAANETFTYYTTQIAAETADPLFKITNPTAFNTGNTSVWVRVETINSCYRVARLNISVTATNITSSFERIFHACDDFLDTNGNNNANNDDRDGIATFDFSSVTADIVALLPSSSGYSIKYYRNQADAAAETDEFGNSLEITNLSNYRNIGYPNMQQIWVRVESDIDNACFGVGPYVKLIVEPLPDIRLTDERLICLNLPNEFITLDSGLPAGSDLTQFTYEWTFAGNILPDTTPTLDVNAAGTYTVKVTSLYGCTRTQTITVNASDIAHVEDIKVADLTDINSISIYVSGTGDYVFALDHPDTFQESPFFNDVLPGVHEVYIKDLTGCGIVGPIPAYVLGAPRYFTPNGDGFNDTWNLKGANADFNRNAIIHIYDRYGKFIKQISPIGTGWDGKFNERAMPSDDYWFSIKLDDGRIVKGHFALKR